MGLGAGNIGDPHTKFLLDHLQNLFLIELLGEALDRGQGLTTIALYDTCC